MLVIASGAITKLDLMEIVDFKNIAKKAHKMGEVYRPPGG
jgi:hypothetical protein